MFVTSRTRNRTGTTAATTLLAFLLKARRFRE